MTSRAVPRSLIVTAAALAVSVWAVGQDSSALSPAAPATSAPAAIAAPDAPQQDAPAPKIPPEEMAQLLAPVALYPDALLSQVLMASTYPLEVVQARRWVEAHPNLQGDELATELAKETWDPSVKSLVATPSVLQLMDDKLEWTIKLGDAFLAQQADLMTIVQQLRAQAQAAGNLQNTEQQRVNVQPAPPAVTDQYAPPAAPAPVIQNIIIEDTSPDYVYVPVYDPGYVYGSWAYVNYQPFFWRPRTYVPTRGIWYDRPRPCGPAWSYAWGRFDWRQRQLELDAGRAARYRQQLDRDESVRRIRERDERFRDGRSEEWRHDNAHRLGVGYRDTATARRYTGRDDVRTRGDGRADSVRSRADRPQDSVPQIQRPVIPNGSGNIKTHIMPGANPPNNPGRVPPAVTPPARDRVTGDGNASERNERGPNDSQRAGRQGNDGRTNERQQGDNGNRDRNDSERTRTDRQPADRQPADRQPENNRSPERKAADAAPATPAPSNDRANKTDRPQQPAPADAPSRRQVIPSPPKQETPAPRGDAPVPPKPAQPAPRAERQAPAEPTPAPKADRPAPVRPAPVQPAPAPPAPIQPTPQPAPKVERQAPAPQPAPAPKSERPAPAPQPAPAPERPVPRPAPAPTPPPAPERPAPRPAPTPAPERPAAPVREAAPDRGGRSGGDGGDNGGRTNRR